MAKVLLTKIVLEFVPDVSFINEETDELEKNLDREKEDQIKIGYELCDPETQYAYLDKKKGIKLRQMVKDYTKYVKGLENCGITDGKSLISAPKTKEVLQMIDQTFERITLKNVEDEDLEDE